MREKESIREQDFISHTLNHSEDNHFMSIFCGGVSAVVPRSYAPSYEILYAPLTLL